MTRFEFSGGGGGGGGRERQRRVAWLQFMDVVGGDCVRQ